MNPERNPHDRAMDLACFADLETKMRDGNPEKARAMFEEALALEIQALEGVDPERHRLSWAVLHRSAGWLAVRCGNFQKARELAEAGLAGNPPGEIASELEELLEAIKEKEKP